MSSASFNHIDVISKMSNLRLVAVQYEYFIAKAALKMPFRVALVGASY